MRDTQVYRSELPMFLTPRKFPLDSHLPGERTYSPRQSILVPYRKNGRLTAKQTTYNTKDAMTRVAIEWAFGLLKGQFRCLRYVEAHRPDNTAMTIVAACILHSACMERQNVYNGPLFTENTEVTGRKPKKDSESGDGNDAPTASETSQGAKRDYIMQNL